MCLCSFIRGDQYAIGLALLDEGKVVLGAMACPNLPFKSIDHNGVSSGDQVGALFSATIGCGSTVESLEDSQPQKVIYHFLLNYLWIRLFPSLNNIIFLPSCFLTSNFRSVSVLSAIQWMPHSLNLMKENTACVIALPPLQRLVPKSCIPNLFLIWIITQVNLIILCLAETWYSSSSS